MEKGYFKDNKQGTEALEDLKTFFEYGVDLLCDGSLGTLRLWAI